MRVLKFGGTSVADSNRLQLVSEIIAARYNSDLACWVVVSAFGGVTDLLLSAISLAEKSDESYKILTEEFISRVHAVAESLLGNVQYSKLKIELEENHHKLINLLSGIYLVKEATAKTKDLVLSFGERNSAFILNTFLLSQGIPSEYVEASKYIKTDASFGNAIVDFELTNQLINSTLSEKGKVYVITGFIGSDKASGLTTTLGRGGSDYSAAIFASALKVDALEIWTDVSGVLTTNPKLVSKAYPIPHMTYEEAAEMSHFGAKVLYAPTIRPVRELNIPVWIKNTFDRAAPGTLISNNKVQDDKKIISGLSSIDDLCLLSLEGTGMQGIPGIAERFFKSLAREKINVIMITQASSENSITIAIKADKAKYAISSIEQEFKPEISQHFINPVKLEDNISLIAIVGENMKNTPGVAGLLFNTLGKNGINLEAIAQGSSELNITFAIRSHLESKALNCIHDAFFLSKCKTVHLYIVGVGLIGSTLLQQIEENRERLLKEEKIEFVINGLSNSRKMLLSNGLMDAPLIKDFYTHGEPSDLDVFISTMVGHDFAHSIFIDNTASEGVSKKYQEILNHNIAISTPNKLALSGAIDTYKEIKRLALLKGIPFNFETNVGAGLPVISSIRSLISSGDTINKIEAVLSGSLSYIFNHFNSSSSFCQVVKEAQGMGLTEPDPRQDLSGADVRRKILILARESGSDLELSDIQLDGLLSEDCLNAPSINKFYELLDQDGRFNSWIINAEENNQKLRFIAVYENQTAKIGLHMVDQTNPFYGLSGKDNMIAIYTDRYNETPLVIRGPGAGAEVTAAGLLAELVNMSQYL